MQEDAIKNVFTENHNYRLKEFGFNLYNKLHL